MAKSRRSAPRHAFRFQVQSEDDGKIEVMTIWAKVRRATKRVELMLTAADVRRSIQLKGAGNTQTCSMACCAKRHAGAFPHKVDGYIDWQYSRAFIVSKRSKKTGLPTECVVYAHSDKIAKINDSKGGQLKLLKELEENGDRTIRLHPVTIAPVRPGRPRGKNTGERASRPAAVGAKLRFANFSLGGVPA